MEYCNNSSFISPRCASTSVGAGNGMFVTLVQTILAAQCSISPPEMWPKDYGKIASKKGLGKYDFIVIGAGSGGATVAARLSEMKDKKILLIEAGENPSLESVIPGFLSTLPGSDADWQFKVESSRICKAFGGRCPLPRGKMLGGCSSINNMAYVRGNKRDYDGWAEAGNYGWDWENVLRYFKKSEDCQIKSFLGEYHSEGGPLKVDFLGNLTDKDRIIYEAAMEFGFPLLEDSNAGRHIGYGNSEMTASQGRRQSTAQAFLHPAKDRPNLHVIKNGLVTKILFKNGRANAVKIIYDDTIEMVAYAEEEIILSAGAVMSPVLLMLSGIGPKEHLEKWNIPCIADLPVGQNLMDHTFLHVFLSFNPTDGPEPPTFQFDSLYNMSIHNTGPLVASPLLQGLFSTTYSRYPDIQLFPQYFRQNSSTFRNLCNVKYYTNDEDTNESLLEENENRDIVDLLMIFLTPKSKGFIELNGTSIYDKPLINGGDLTNIDDMKTLLKGLKQQISFLESESYRRNGGEFFAPKIKQCEKHEFMTEKYLRCFIQYFAASGFHVSGTTKMGPRYDPTAVVDPELRIIGVDGLRVMDAGVFPVIPSANTNAPTIMVAEKGAAMIKRKYSPKKHANVNGLGSPFRL